MNEPNEWEKPDDPYSTPHHHGTPGVSGQNGSCLKMFGWWVLPAVVVPLIVLLFIQIWPVTLIAALAFLTWMGSMHADDSIRISGREDSPKWPRVLLYVVIQVVLIPLLWFAVVWGFCAISGSGTFK